MRKVLPALIGVTFMFLCAACVPLAGENVEEDEKETSKYGLTVEMKFGTGVEDREVVGEADEFSPDVGRVYCWTVVKGAEEETTVTHVWYLEGKKKSEVELPVKFRRHRTWSYKTVTPEMTGEWSVDVLDADGVVLESASFTIK